MGVDTINCRQCGKPHAEKHHIFFGKNRKTSDKQGFITYLCSECHRGTYGVHGLKGHNLDLKLKKQAQREFEKTRSREDFIKLIGRNYL